MRAAYAAWLFVLFEPVYRFAAVDFSETPYCLGQSVDLVRVKSNRDGARARELESFVTNNANHLRR